MRSSGVGGLAATSQFVIASGREANNSADGFRCFDAQSGSEVWKLTYTAKGDLDYGNSPRATPLINGELVYLLGAFGHLHCVRLSTGEIVWKKDLRSEFRVTSKLVWGHSSSPLIADNKLIVNPGAPDAAFVALDPASGKTIWKTAGDAAAFASFILMTVRGKQQLIGYDAGSLVGLDPNSGQKLWRHVPPRSNDFNVPTPIEWKGKLILSTENNGTRIHEFDDKSCLIDEPVAVNFDLAPDTHTPIVIGDRLFGIWNDLYCLDLNKGLNAVWTGEHDTYNQYGCLIGSENQLLVAGSHGEFVLINPKLDRYEETSRVKVVDDDSGVYSHPAIVGRKLYVRTSTDVRCVLLS